MTTSAEIFLGVIAVATLVIAVVQIGLIVAAVTLARRGGRLADQVEREVRPLFVHLDEIGRDVSRVTALAVAQVERADRLAADFTKRIEQAMAVVQEGILGSAREGRAVLKALRAVFEALWESRAGGRRARGDDEDSLFV